MRIGILTFSSAYNFGAQLQAYALLKILQQDGHDVEIVNYRPSYMVIEQCKLSWRCFVSRNPMRIPNKLKEIFGYRNYYNKYYSFGRHYLQLSDYDNPVHYDIMILGSDQIWNKKYNGNDSVWYGKLPTNIIADRVITYAASAGDATGDEINNELTEKYVSKIKTILVRETCLKQTLKIKFGIESTLVLDPVLMAPDIIWNEWKRPILRKPYVLVYQGREDDNVLRIAKAIATQLNCQVVTTDHYLNSKSKGFHHVTLSPDEFITYVNNARCVVTSSFHGTAAAIVCGTPFYSIKMEDGADERVTNILVELGLTERFIKKTETPKFSNVDYAHVFTKLDILRNISQSELAYALKE